MDRAEIADRLRQYSAARLEFVCYKAGAKFWPTIRSTPFGDQPRFLFSPEDVHRLCLRLRELFPQTAERIIERAEGICQHRFDLLGYQALDYGNEIDWHCDRVHAKRAPRKPWFRVRYLDFEEVGDSKVIWELNRHQHLVTLAKAFRLTDNQKFAAELFRQWDHWHQENPYPIGINWASSLEVAFRSLSWLWIYFLLSDCDCFPTSFRTHWLRSLAVSGRHIERHLSTYFSPNTHLLGEAVALFFIGTLCPEIPSAKRWQRQGWKLVQQEAKRQVRSDGIHFEQSIYYHVYALDFFLHTTILASLNNIAVPEALNRTIEHMLEALEVLARAGSVPRFGDDDGGRLFDPTRNSASDLLDPLAAGAVLFERGDFKAIAGGPREEMLWLLGIAGLERFDRIDASVPSHASVAFPISGLYVLAKDDPREQIVIDAGPQGAHSAGHGHADALSITWESADQSVLVDSGTFQYVGNRSLRNQFRGTRAHNTMLIDGRDQSEPRGPFGWERLPRVRAEDWISGKTFDLFAGSHDGYGRLPNAIVHRRFVFSLKSGFSIVRDLAIGFGEHELDLFWHLGVRLHPCEKEENCFWDGEKGLRVVTLDDHGWTSKVEEHPDSPVYGRSSTHRTLHFATRVQLPAEFVTLFATMTELQPAESELTLTSSQDSNPVVGYRYRSTKGEHKVFFGQKKDWELDGWSTDAEFMYVGPVVSEAAPVLICCNFTHLAHQGRTLANADQTVLRCEIIGDEPFEVISTNQDSVSVDYEAFRQAMACQDSSPLTFNLT